MKPAPTTASSLGKWGSWPLHGWLGLALVVVCWPLNWTLPGNRTLLLFFPLWLGYILVVDALVLTRTGSSILSRSKLDFVMLFIASVPAWWLFEWFNKRLQNWVYHGGEELGPLAHFLISSLCFSTVIPAVFETAELVRSLPFVARFASGPVVPNDPPALRRYVAIGLVMLVLLMIWPRIFFPLVWISLVLILDPLCVATGRPALLDRLRQGDWRPVVSLALGAIVCGFFWELWNFWAYPKWTYRIPIFGFLHVFEMPALGYLGYLPFGLELYPLTHLLLPRAPRLRL